MKKCHRCENLDKIREVAGNSVCIFRNNCPDWIKAIREVEHLRKQTDDLLAWQCAMQCTIDNLKKQNAISS